MENQKQIKEKKNYAGHVLSAGIDVHKKTWHVSVSSEHLMLQSFTYPADPVGLAKYLKSKYPGAEWRSCYEAGYFGYWIHRQLEKASIKNLIVNASDVPTSDKEKKHKRDKLDSRKLSKCLRGGLLEGIYVLSEQQEQDRHLLRTRKRLVRDITRCKNRIKSWLAFSGISPARELENSNWSAEYISWLYQIEWNFKSGAQAMESQLIQLKSLKEELKRINRTIVKLAHSERYARHVKIIRSIKGFGLLSSMVLLTELMPIERFTNEQSLRNYAGLIPTSSDSGEKQRPGPMTKRGNKYVKEVLIECSWRAVSSDPVLVIYYENLCKRMKGNQAIIRVASKLIRRIRAMLLKGEEYQYDRA